VICLVADGFGVGEAPDAAKYGDVGSNTLANTAKAVGGLKLPTLEKLGLGCLTPTPGLACERGLGSAFKLQERSEGKDTTTGHWELAGLVTRDPFPLYPQGFPKELLEKWRVACELPGYLGNYPASGTEIIKDLGLESVQSGKPIVYTSGDSVFQIAAHEEVFGLEKLYRVCEEARKLTLPYNIGRVIARPFTGKETYQRTKNRKDYAISPPPNLLDKLLENEVQAFGVGKIEDIFAHRGLTDSNHTGDNATSLIATLDYLRKSREKDSFIFVNLVDFDMLFGHRRDAAGFARALTEMDQFLPKLLEEMHDDDLIFLTADHGCDPTFRGTDHTREFVPCLMYGKKQSPIDFKTPRDMSDLGATVLNAFNIPNSMAGQSFLK